MKFKTIFMLAFFVFGCTSTTEKSTDNTGGNNGGGDGGNNGDAKITFTGDIKAIFQNNCGSCHTGGGSQPNWTVYSNAKNSVTEILRRIQLNTNENGFMPDGRGKLSTEKIDKIKQWKTDGLLE